ncbi:DUF4269 domain-containing protein [Polluticaenibacter yanchengensis]|uniref:DUF4269 domain-containing protein n=1 Tax=Polluticaenibacter yanchengensis TaxID=3014562 RepID=A0ABT4UMQ9_9BACT|nr:DUF4269 domain-containing protein [Chitinophagaceae bacterium LY-5]
MHFDTIDYLQQGNTRQQQAYKILTEFRIFELLKPFNPILTGTIPIHIDIENSDLDIICYTPDYQEFLNTLDQHFRHFEKFSVSENHTTNIPAIVAGFYIGNTEIEIFGQNLPVKSQNAYRHMLIEHALLQKHGEPFRQQIIALKEQGLKTEPAFAQLLNLEGDPYTELLKLEAIDAF